MSPGDVEEGGNDGDWDRDGEDEGEGDRESSLGGVGRDIFGVLPLLSVFRTA